MTLYDTDFMAWTSEQARLLRERRFADNRLDIETLAEEIESMGREQLWQVESHLTNIMTHLLKLAACTRPEPQAHWRVEIRTFHASLTRRYSASMRQYINMAALYAEAVENARDGLVASGETLNAPQTCPFNLDDLLAKPLDIAALLAKTLS